jgi:hypothetical protein
VTVCRGRQGAFRLEGGQVAGMAAMPLAVRAGSPCLFDGSSMHAKSTGHLRTLVACKRAHSHHTRIHMYEPPADWATLTLMVSNDAHCQQCWIIVEAAWYITLRQDARV